MKNKIFNVEFLGMPGSGKSYIQNIVLKKLKLKNYLNYYSDYKLLNRISKIFFFFRFLLSYPIFSLKTITFDNCTIFLFDRSFYKMANL